jgi:hypothetical protein
MRLRPKEIPFTGDPTPDIAIMMDRAKLTGGQMLQGRANMSTLVSRCRQELSRMLVDYIKKRDAAVAEAARKEES